MLEEDEGCRRKEEVWGTWTSGRREERCREQDGVEQEGVRVISKGVDGKGE